MESEYEIPLTLFMLFLIFITTNTQYGYNT